MGIANYRFRVTCIMKSINDAEKHQKHIDREVSLVLALLPYGTKLVEIVEDPVIDLSIHYVARLENSIFIDDADIEIDLPYTRQICVVQDENGEDRLHQFNGCSALNFKDFVQTKSYKDDTKMVTLKEYEKELGINND